MYPEYTIIIYTPQELNHASYIQTGLFELEALGFIQVKVKLKISKDLGKIFVSKKGKILETKQAFPKTSYFKLISKRTKKEVLFAIDLYDAPNQFSAVAFDKCDFIFKRNFESKFIKALPKSSQNKIFKLGISFGVHSNFTKGKNLFLIGLFLSNLNVNFKIDRFCLKRLSKSFKLQMEHWNFVKTTRKLERFESFNKAKKVNILFQTRCFPHEDQEDIKAIHQQRYEIIKLLRGRFPNEFKGGFIPSKIAIEKYQDALTTVPSEPKLYLQALKKAKIVIYTRGLANSPAWKMAEYLSQGKIIIAEDLTTELPVTLEHRKEVLFFNSNEELIQNIQLVLSDNSLADYLSKNARLYFENYVHPRQNVKRILDLMITNFKFKG